MDMMLFILFVAFLMLKLCGIVFWSWFVVFSPILIMLIIAAVLVILIMLLEQ